MIALFNHIEDVASGNPKYEHMVRLENYHFFAATIRPLKVSLSLPLLLLSVLRRFPAYVHSPKTRTTSQRDIYEVCEFYEGPAPQGQFYGHYHCETHHGAISVFRSSFSSLSATRPKLRLRQRQAESGWRAYAVLVE